VFGSRPEAYGGRPRFNDESAYLLDRLRQVRGLWWASRHRRAWVREHRQSAIVPYYVCLDHKRRGTYANSMTLQQDIIDWALLGAIADVLDERILDRAVDRDGR
jgi:hypothetical protein